MKTQVIITDTQAAVRQLLGCCMEHGHGCTVVGEAKTGHEAVKLCRDLKPELLVLEVALPELNGVEVLRIARREWPEMRVLVFTGVRNEKLLLEALLAMPHGFVHKEDSLDMLNEAVRAVLRGCRYFTPYATRLVDAAARGGNGHTTNGVTLTHCERHVLQMVAESLTSKQIAERMGVSPKTVEHHRANLMRKAGVRDVAGLTRYALRHGVVLEG